MSITRNENLNPSLNLLINCISAKSAPQILSLNAEYTIFQIRGLSNSSDLNAKITELENKIPSITGLSLVQH